MIEHLWSCTLKSRQYEIKARYISFSQILLLEHLKDGYRNHISFAVPLSKKAGGLNSLRDSL